MPPKINTSEEVVDTQAPESEDQVLTDDEVAAAAGGLSGKTGGPRDKSADGRGDIGIGSGSA